MVEGTGSSERGAGTTTPRRPGLIRSIAHRLAGEHLALPVEGRLAGSAGATRWLNSEPLTPKGLRGRVVLVDFWTYTCVNWLRTLPYRRAWAAKYSASMGSISASMNALTKPASSWARSEGAKSMA